MSDEKEGRFTGHADIGPDATIAALRAELAEAKVGKDHCDGLARVRLNEIRALEHSLSAAKAENERLRHLADPLSAAAIADREDLESDLTALRELLRRWLDPEVCELKYEDGTGCIACLDFDGQHEPGCIVADTRAAIGDEK